MAWHGGRGGGGARGGRFSLPMLHHVILTRFRKHSAHRKTQRNGSKVSAHCSRAVASKIETTLIARIARQFRCLPSTSVLSFAWLSCRGFVSEESVTAPHSSLHLLANNEQAKGNLANSAPRDESVLTTTRLVATLSASHRILWLVPRLAKDNWKSGAESFGIFGKTKPGTSCAGGTKKDTRSNASNCTGAINCY